MKKQKPKWLYRLEFKDNSCGLWYNGEGKWCFEKGIGSLDDSCKTKSLPMDYDERYKKDGRDWFSSCSKKEDLLHWYSKEDARILLNKGFVFTKYLATEYTEYDQQTVFIKETALRREEIDFFSLFEEKTELEQAAADYALDYADSEEISTWDMECAFKAGAEWMEEHINKDNIIIQRDWFSHLRRYWYKQGVIDGKYNKEEKEEVGQSSSSQQDCKT